MKKALVLVLSLVMILSLVSCKQQTESPQPQKTTSTTAEASVETFNAEDFSYTYPEMTAEDKKLYKKYIYPYEAMYMCMFDWDEKDHSEISLWTFYLLSVGVDNFIEGREIDEDGYCLLSEKDLEDIKSLIKTKFLIDDEELDSALKSEFELRGDSYWCYANYGGCGADHFVTDSEIDGDILSLNVSYFWDVIGYFLNDQAPPTYDNGELVEDGKSVIKIKLLDNGDFKFISNTMIKK